MRVTASPDRPALLDFDFVDAAPPWRSGCVWLAGARREAWLPAQPLRECEAGSGSRREAGGLAVLGLQQPLGPDEDPAAVTESLYRALFARVRPSAQPYLIRLWNFFGAINAGAGDAERYRRFCVGRDAAADAQFRDPPPAATAIGAAEPGAPLSVVALCSERPAIALENPRQTPAWAYPRRYGPVSPGFSRGAVLHDGDAALLLASGTASIVGHASRHEGDVLAQLDESVLNLGVLLEEGARRSGRTFAMGGLQALRVYLRDPAALPAVRQGLIRQGFDLERVALLHGEVCRRELEIELEGVFAAE